MVNETNSGQDFAFILNDLNARIRVLENKYSLFGERLLVINQNMIEEYKKIIRNIRSVDDEIKEIKKDIFNIKEIISGLTKELKLFARKDSLKVLEKYINLWNPMNFVTEKDVNNIINHNDEILLKKEFLEFMEEQKKEIIKEIKQDIKDEIINLIKQENKSGSLKKEIQPKNIEKESD